MTDTLALCYHGVSETWPASISVTPARLRSQLDHLVGKGYRGVPLRQAVLDPPGGRVLAVTFDDGYRSVLRHALPILERMGIPGSIYVPTDLVGQAGPMSWEGIGQWSAGPHAEELLPLNWDELRGLAAAGWEIGSHTCSHPRLTSLADAELERELVESRAVVERELDAPCDTLAYPYGDFDRRVAAAARRAGYRVGAAIASNRPAAPLDWPRVGVYHGDAWWRFRAKVSPAVRRLRRRGEPHDVEGRRG